MARALRLTWLDRFGGLRRRSEAARPPIMASRDLPPLDPLTRLALPRSPDPMPDEALVFARGAALRAVETNAKDENETAPAPAPAPALSIVEGADLRAMLERIEQSSRRREALDQSAQARARIVERLSAGKAGLGMRPPLQLVGGQKMPADALRESHEAAHQAGLEQAMDEALASALGTLKQLSELPRH